MSTTTIILIAVAVAAMFLMHRVGHGVHGHAAHGGGKGTDPEHLHGARQLDSRETAAGDEAEHDRYESQEGESQHRRHGC